MWQSDTGSYMTVSGGIAYCDALTWGGYSNWRLPTKDELKSLVVCSNGTSTPLDDYSDCGQTEYAKPTIDIVFSCTKESYRSATHETSGEYWIVDFDSGDTDIYPGGSGSYKVRCVR